MDIRGFLSSLESAETSLPMDTEIWKGDIGGGEGWSEEKEAEASTSEESGGVSSTTSEGEWSDLARDFMDNLEAQGEEMTVLEMAQPIPVEERGRRGSFDVEEDASDSTDTSVDTTNAVERFERDVRASLRTQWPVHTGREQGDFGRGNARQSTRASAKGKKKLLPGEKKALRREKIKAKRTEREKNRGFDLTIINAQLEEFVASGGDIWALPPIKKKDHHRVAQLAAVYGLNCTRSGGGKKSVPTLRPTNRTSLPTGKNLERLKDLLGIQVEEPSSGNRPAFTSRQISIPGASRIRQAEAGLSLSPTSDATLARRSGQRKMRRRDASTSLPAEPLSRSFVSTGTVEVEHLEAMFREARVDSTPTSSMHRGTSVQGFASFENHTTGFGSRMMEKMGFRGAGHGIGRDAQGLVSPVSVQMREKRVGLGAELP